MPCTTTFDDVTPLPVLRPSTPHTAIEAFPWDYVTHSDGHAPSPSPTLKRLEDIFLGALFVSIAAIPMLVVALCLKVSYPRQSVLFSQWRTGLYGKRFRILKFRTMLCSEDGDSVRQADKHDPRTTRLGRFLRRTSLDEFPQFLQVLTGELSLVGPRPHAIAHDEYYRARIPGYALRYATKPGITGWAQVNGHRGATDTVEKMQARVAHDLTYLRNWSITNDIRIVLKTIFGTKTRQNAF